MNFALPGIFVSLGIDSVDNSDFPVRLSTATLGLSLHHTEHGQTVPGGDVTILGELRPVVPADLPGRGLVPPGEHEAVALGQCSSLSLVEVKQGLDLISRELHSIAGASNLMP